MEHKIATKNGATFQRIKQPMHGGDALSWKSQKVKNANEERQGHPCLFKPCPTFSFSPV